MPPESEMLGHGGGTEFVREIDGFGFAFDLAERTHAVRITKVYSKSPAAGAGLTAGLLIQRINAVPTSGKTTAECLGLPRAKGAEKASLEIVTLERRETNIVELARGKFLTSS